MMDATLETGPNKLTNGTIAIVEDDNFNQYTWNASIVKWKPRIGNKYTSLNLPSVIDFVLDEGDEIWDSTLGLKRRWVDSTWEPQKDVEYVMLAGHGPPTQLMGKYGNYYTDLDNGKQYVKNAFSKTKINTLSMCDAGILTVTTPTAGVVTLTYSSGAGTPTIVFTGNKTISSTDTVTSGLNYNATNKSWYTPITLLLLKAFSNFLITNGGM